MNDANHEDHEGLERLATKGTKIAGGLCVGGQRYRFRAATGYLGPVSRSSHSVQRVDA
jgi:hypothetical protein